MSDTEAPSSTNQPIKEQPLPKLNISAGDRVNYWAHATIHNTEGSQPQSARVASVLPTPDGEPQHVNLQVLAHDATTFAATSVIVLAADAEAPAEGAFCKVLAA